MTRQFKRGDRVEWNFRGRKVVGKIQRKLTARTEVNGLLAAASSEDPRYVVRSEKTGKEGVRRAEKLKKL